MPKSSWAAGKGRPSSVARRAQQRASDDLRFRGSDSSTIGLEAARRQLHEQSSMGKLSGVEGKARPRPSSASRRWEANAAQTEKPTYDMNGRREVPPVVASALAAASESGRRSPTAVVVPSLPSMDIGAWDSGVSDEEPEQELAEPAKRSPRRETPSRMTGRSPARLAAGVSSNPYSVQRADKGLAKQGPAETADAGGASYPRAQPAGRRSGSESPRILLAEAEALRQNTEEVETKARASAAAADRPSEQVENVVTLCEASTGLGPHQRPCQPSLSDPIACLHPNVSSLESDATSGTLRAQATIHQKLPVPSRGS